MRRAKAWEKCGGIGKVRLHFRHLAVVISGLVIPGPAEGRSQESITPRIPDSRAKAPRSEMAINQTRRA